MLSLAFLLEVAATPGAPAVPQRFSILAPNCPERAYDEEDIVVCTRGMDSPLLPLPGERGPPDRPVPHNPDLVPAAALDGPTPCAAIQGGCPGGIKVFAPPVMLVRVVEKLIDPNSECCVGNEATDPIALIRDGVRAVKRATAKKPDRSNRTPIPLEDDPPPPLAR